MERPPLEVFVKVIDWFWQIELPGTLVKAARGKAFTLKGPMVLVVVLPGQGLVAVTVIV